MAKFNVILNVMVEANTMDEAVTKAAVYMVNKCSQHLPVMTIAKPMPFQSYQTAEINLFEAMQINLFPNGTQLPDETAIVDVRLPDRMPEPTARM